MNNSNCSAFNSWNPIIKKTEFNSKCMTKVFTMTCRDNLPTELRHLIFKFKRLNHFKKWISITSQFVQVIYLCHLSKMAVVIESHELMNKSYLSVINYGWKNDLLQLKATSNKINAKSLYKSFQ